MPSLVGMSTLWGDEVSPPAVHLTECGLDQSELKQLFGKEPINHDVLERHEPHVVAEPPQWINVLEERHSDTEAKLTELVSHFQDLKVRQQRQEEQLLQLAAEVRQESDGGQELTGLPSSRSCATYQDFFEQHQSRRSVQERASRGITVDFLEVDAEEIYPFDESTWDIAIFIGTPSLGVGGSGITSVLLMMNVVMQVVFVGIVWFNFAEAQINEDDIEDARKWRINYAHDDQHMDLQSGFSLVSRVCANDKSLQIASSQETLYEFLGDYLKPNASGFEAIFVGKMLCIVALVCWFLMVSKEIHKALDLFRAMMFLPRGLDKLVPVERPGLPTTFRVASISRGRVFFSGVIVAYRVIVSGILAYCGTFFLVYTIEITELVLNAVALDIILNVDDLLFDAVTTANARHLVLKLEPLRMPRWPHRKGIDLKSVSMALLIPGSVMLVYNTMIDPMVDTLSQVAHALCGGTQDFVFSKDQLRMILFATTRPCTDGCRMPTNASSSVKSLAVQDVVEKGRRNNSEFAIWAGDYHALQIRKALSFELAVAQVSQGTCVDNLKGPYLHYMRQLMDNSTISECKDVKYWCSSPSFEPEWGPDGGKGLYARLLCPHTCECDNPGGKIGLISGCPGRCTQKTHPTYFQLLNQSNNQCRQRDRDSLINASDWIAWIAQMRQYARFKKDNDMRQYSSHMASGGCDNMFITEPALRCTWKPSYTQTFKGIAFFCPDTCRCHGYVQRPNCPSTCKQKAWWGK